MKRVLTRREFVRYAAAGIGTVAAGMGSGNVHARGGSAKPNILYVFADQMRFCAMGCTGNDFVKTPHLDRLASQGILFTNALSNSPVCSPYRAQLMTGRYGHTTGIITNDIKLPEEEVTIAEVLKHQGYATGYIGKWHLEGGRRAPKGDPRREGFVPSGEARQGFDYWAALECSHKYFHTKYYRDTAEPILVDGYEPAVQTDLAIEYMRQHKHRPFLLMLSWGPPHNPYTPPEKYAIYDPREVPLRPNVPKEKEEQARKNIAHYYGLVTSLDDNMARLMKALDELGIANNTIVCFTADHGDMLHSHGERLKQRPWEESLHIPFIMRYPSQIEADQEKDVLFNSVDVMPTLLGLCGVAVPEGAQGKDLSQVILGGSDQEPESAYFAISIAGRNTPLHAPWRGVRTKEWMFAESAAIEGGDWVLYNFRDDPFELNNLVSDPKFRDKKDELKALLRKWRENTSDDIDLAAVLRESRERKMRKEKMRKGRDPHRPGAKSVVD